MAGESGGSATGARPMAALLQPGAPPFEPEVPDPERVRRALESDERKDYGWIKERTGSKIEVRIVSFCLALKTGNTPCTVTLSPSSPCFPIEIRRFPPEWAHPEPRAAPRRAIPWGRRLDSRGAQAIIGASASGVIE